MQIIERYRWAGAAAAIALAVGGLVQTAQSQEQMPATPEPFPQVPQDLHDAAQKAIDAVDYLRGGSLEYVVVTTSNGSRIFKVGDIEEGTYKVDEIQDEDAGEIVRIPRWSDKGAELIDPAAEDVGQYIVIITSSPGSGNDCRRGGSCRGADAGG